MGTELADIALNRIIDEDVAEIVDAILECQIQRRSQGVVGFNKRAIPERGAKDPDAIDKEGITVEKVDLM